METRQLDFTQPAETHETVKIPYVLKDRLLMEQGEFNGEFYPIEAILRASSQFDNLPMYLGHTPDANVKIRSAVGIVKNPEIRQLGVYGDLHIFDPITAHMHASGVKWGLSPSMKVDPAIIEGKPTIRELELKSLDLVIDPAIKATRLNSQKKMATEKTKEKDDQDVMRQLNDAIGALTEKIDALQKEVEALKEAGGSPAGEKAPPAEPAQRGPDGGEAELGQLEGGDDSTGKQARELASTRKVGEFKDRSLDTDTDVDAGFLRMLENKHPIQ